LKNRRDEIGIRYDQVWFESQQLHRQRPNARRIVGGVTKLNPNVAPIYPTQLSKLLSERYNLCLPIRITLVIRHHHADLAYTFALLRESCERIRNRAAHQRDELAPSHRATGENALSPF
jgi:hypothetical protein